MKGLVPVSVGNSLEANVGELTALAIFRGASVIGGEALRDVGMEKAEALIGGPRVAAARWLWMGVMPNATRTEWAR